jgi:hypothetical protein
MMAPFLVSARCQSLRTTNTKKGTMLSCSRGLQNFGTAERMDGRLSCPPIVFLSTHSLLKYLLPSGSLSKHHHSLSSLLTSLLAWGPTAQALGEPLNGHHLLGAASREIGGAQQQHQPSFSSPTSVGLRRRTHQGPSPVSSLPLLFFFSFSCAGVLFSFSFSCAGLLHGAA